MNQWHTFGTKSDEGPAKDCAIGLIVLDSDVVIEQEVRRFLPADGVGLYSSRISIAPTLSPAALHNLVSDIPSAVKRLVPNDKLNVIAFGCTSASIALGSRVLADIIREIRPNVLVTDPINSALEAISHLGAKRLAVLTPYEPSLNQLFDDFWPEASQVPIIARGCFNKNSDPLICRISPDDIYQAALSLVRESEADCLFISCTALRCSGIIEKIETEMGISVVTSNQALAWHAMKLTNTHNQNHYGKLFSV